MSLERDLHRAARVAGDARAIAKGPAAVGRRLVRRQIARLVWKLVPRWP